MVGGDSVGPGLHFEFPSRKAITRLKLRRMSIFHEIQLAIFSVRPIREFQEMLITDINARTHPITDTDIRYESHSMAVGLLLMPYSFPPPTSPIVVYCIGTG